MAVRPQRPGLTWAIFAITAVALVVLVLTLLIVVPSQADRYLSDALADRGRAATKEVEHKIAIAPREGIDHEASAELNAIVSSEREVADIQVFVCGEQACQPTDLIAATSGVRPAATEEALRALHDSLESGKTLPSGLMFVSARVMPRTGSGTAFIVVTLDRTRVNDASTGLRGTLLVALISTVAIFLALIGVLSRVLLIRPIRAMRAMAGRLSEADLSGRVEGAGARELDELAAALNNIGQGLRDTLGRVRGVAESVALVIDQISRTASSTTSGASTVLTRVEETSSAMVQMLASLRGIADNVEVLFQSAEDSSSSISEMATTNDEVAANVTKMAASVEETSSAIEQMTYAVKEVARNIEDLLRSTEATSTSIREMEVATGQVQVNVVETSRLSEQVSKDSESGMESIQKTIIGIDKIKDSSRTAATVIEQLGKRVGEIGNIVDVIDDVAEQTNLLALNAAIIAAQAGEHGKGFAVVAEEIKDLSDRTAASTKEIADLIRAVQHESRNAANAMTQGVRHVEEGVLLGREAESALKKIQESARNSMQMVRAIARATEEQADGSKDITHSVERIRDTIESINKATNEQARGSEQVMKAAEQMKMLTQHVKHSVDEQTHGGKQINRSIENINEMVTHLNRAQKEQTRGSEQVLAAIEAIKAVSEQQTRSVKQLEDAIETLRVQADVLRGEVRRFRV